MPVTTIPLVGQMTARGFAKTIGTSSKDQQYINCLFEVAVNPALGKKALYVVKRPGSTTSSSIGATCYAVASYSSYFTNMSCTSTALFRGSTNIGTISSIVNDLSVADTVMNATEVICFNTTGSAVYFVFKDAVTTNFPTFSGDTHTNTTIDNIASTTGLYPGQLITGTGIQAGTRILTITSATAITTTIATTGTATITITKEAVALVLDADSPAAAGVVASVSALNGYMFTGTTDGRIFNCPVNSPWLQTAADYISADFGADNLQALYKWGNYIIAGGAASLQYFQITGNASGSILSAAQALNKQTDIPSTLKPRWVGGSGYLISGATDAGYSIYKMSSPTDMATVTDPVTGAIISGNITSGGLGTVTITGDKKLVMACNGNGTSSVVYDDTTRMASIYKMDANILSSFGTTFTKSGATTLFTWAAGDTWTDSSAAYTMTIQTEPLVLNNGRYFVIDRVELIADTQSSGTTALTTYDDDYTTALTHEAFDMTAVNKEVTRLGGFDNHVIFKLEHSANTGFRAQALKIHWRPGY